MPLPRVLRFPPIGMLLVNVVMALAPEQFAALDVLIPGLAERDVASPQREKNPTIGTSKLLGKSPQPLAQHRGYRAPYP